MVTVCHIGLFAIGSLRNASIIFGDGRFSDASCRAFKKSVSKIFKALKFKKELAPLDSSAEIFFLDPIHSNPIEITFDSY